MHARSVHLSFTLGLFCIAHAASAHGPLAMPLVDVPLPPVPGLTDGPDPIVIDRAKAIALGKALFWDVSVGSDGIACASCHFHAGADRRVQNQMSPGQLGSTASAQGFDFLASGSGGPNHVLTMADFPLWQFVNPLDKSQGLLSSTDDVVGSSGSFGGSFQRATVFSGNIDTCARVADPVFHQGSIGTRRVEPRNAPTVINAVFNYRNFWDGRASNVFNGSSPWGDRDPNAGVWVKQNARSVSFQRLQLINSSLASLSTAPPIDATEMACGGRPWPAIGRKLLSRQPLQTQRVHWQDSVLGPLANSTASSNKPGLKTTYRTLVTQAFNPKYWSYGPTGPFGSSPGQAPYNQMEANFAMFFALALQLYQSTLVADDAPVDRSDRNSTYQVTYANLGYDAATLASITRGRNAFFNNHCGTCHAGPTLSTASLVLNSTLVTPTPGAFYGPANARIPYGKNALGRLAGAGAIIAGVGPHVNLVTRDATAEGAKLVDFGFASNGASNPESDPGLAGLDPFGNPLSFAKQYASYLMGDTAAIKDAGITTTRSCDFLLPLAYNLELDDPATFTALDAIEPDGSREGVVRASDCLGDELFEPEVTAYIPTTAAATAAAATAKMAIATQSVFKIPSLRNVELTGPYMHNGSLATLEQVMAFYARGGNVDHGNKHELVNGTNIASDPSQIADLVAFLKTFTDERVRYERAPFDHPQLLIPHGHLENANGLVGRNLGSTVLASDGALLIPEVGASGSGSPLQSFDHYLEP